MALRSRMRQDALLAGCFLLLLLGHVSSRHRNARTDNKETCLLPSDEGFCKAFIPRWYHDQFTKACKEFNWGGCGGNDNNFGSREECDQACHVIKINVDPCLLPSDEGFCKAHIPRWYHDQYTKTCKEFIWGGCEGNDNNFQSKEECEQTCQVIKKSKESCLLPRDVGECKASIPSWYYNQYTKTCQDFTWGGCGGNDNNFESKEECEQICGVVNSFPKECQLHADGGHCRRFSRRYFFNMKTMRCQKFYYGGCRGNKNRFFTETSCLNHCLPGEKYWKK